MREELRQNLKELRDQGMRIDAVNPVSALSEFCTRILLGELCKQRGTNTQKTHDYCCKSGHLVIPHRMSLYGSKEPENGFF